MITLTRDDAITAIDNIARQNMPAARIVNFLIEHGAVFQPPADAPCGHCGKPWDTRRCAIGGCPLGADL